MEFTVDAYPDRTFRGLVESLSPATGAKFSLLPPDNATGNFTKVVQRIPVKIDVAGGDIVFASTQTGRFLPCSSGGNFLKGEVGCAIALSLR